MRLVKRDVLYAAMQDVYKVKIVDIETRYRTYVTECIWNRVERAIGLHNHGWAGYNSGWIGDVR